MEISSTSLDKAERGITVSYETIRQSCHTFGPGYARKIKKRLAPRGDC